MMKKTMLFLLAVLFASSVLFAQETGKSKSAISRDTILIGDQIDWTIELQLAEGEEFSIGKPGAEPAPGVETIKPLNIDTLSSKKGITKIQGRTVLTSFDSGSYALPPIIAAIRRASGVVDTIIFEGPVLEVTTIPVDTATFEPYDIKGQIKYPVTLKELLPWLGLAILLAAIIWLLVRWIRFRKANRDFFGKPKVIDPPHIVALRSLEKTRSQRLWQDNKQKQFYTQVTDALRQYMADRYEMAALEQTTAEIFDALKEQDVTPELYEKLKDLFETADFVKFAKHAASEQENEEAIPTAVRFVNETYMQQVESDGKQVKDKED